MEHLILIYCCSNITLLYLSCLINDLTESAHLLIFPPADTLTMRKNYDKGYIFIYYSLS